MYTTATHTTPYLGTTCNDTAHHQSTLAECLPSCRRTYSTARCPWAVSSAISPYSRLHLAFSTCDEHKPALLKFVPRRFFFSARLVRFGLAAKAIYCSHASYCNHTGRKPRWIGYCAATSHGQLRMIFERSDCRIQRPFKQLANCFFTCGSYLAHTYVHTAKRKSLT
jgi:hypothetical protein